MVVGLRSCRSWACGGDDPQTQGCGRSAADAADAAAAEAGAAAGGGCKLGAVEQNGDCEPGRGGARARQRRGGAADAGTGDEETGPGWR